MLVATAGPDIDILQLLVLNTIPDRLKAEDAEVCLAPFALITT